jgi:hypothetical protein
MVIRHAASGLLLFCALLVVMPATGACADSQAEVERNAGQAVPVKAPTADIWTARALDIDAIV